MAWSDEEGRPIISRFSISYGMPYLILLSFHIQILANMTETKSAVENVVPFIHERMRYAVYLKPNTN